MTNASQESDSPVKLGDLIFEDQQNNTSPAQYAAFALYAGLSFFVLFNFNHAGKDSIFLFVVIPVLFALGQAFQMYIKGCLLYTSPSPRDQRGSRMPSSA